MEKVTVDATALRKVLQALKGAPHEIRELLAIRGLPGYDCPIERLVKEYNEAVIENTRATESL